MSRIQQTPTSGNVEQFPLPEIFLKAILESFSGILDIENDDLTKLIYFKNGNVVFVESNDRNETFGHFLLRKKLIQPDALNKALNELSSQTDLKLGEVLLKQGLISPNTMMEQLNVHQEEKLLNAFSIKTGNYRLISNLEWPDYVTHFPFRTLNIFFSGLEKYVSLDEIMQSACLHPQAKIQLNFKPNRDFPLPPFATRLLNILSRDLVSVDELAKKVSVSTSKIIVYLYSFFLADWIGVQGVERREIVSKDIPDEAKEPEKSEAKAVAEPEKPDSSQPGGDEQGLVEKKTLSPGLLQQLEIDYQKVESYNFYQILEVKPEFSMQQLQVNFFHVITKYKQYEVHQKGREIVTWIKAAYDVLRDEKLKQMYDYRFGFRKIDVNTEGREKNFFRALKLIEKEDIEGAKAILEEINKGVSDSSYKAYLGWVLFRENPKNNFDQAKEILDSAFKIYRADPFAHYIAGQLDLYKKDNTSAEKHFRAAHHVFPQFAEVVSALENMKVEQEKSSSKKNRDSSDEEKKEKTGFFDLSIAGISLNRKD